jgi:histidinol-phosphate aminotransferase
VIHPQFTEPEAALLAAGHKPSRLVLEPPFTLRAESVPEEADLVVVGNPTNPTSVLHPAATIEALAAPQRILLVDEAFIDTIPGEEGSVADRRDVSGLLVIRSLTKTWGLAGLRIGYVLGEPDLIRALREVAPLWPVSTPALAAAIACSTPAAVREADKIAHELSRDRDHLVSRLGTIVVGRPRSSFVLVRLDAAAQVRNGCAARDGRCVAGIPFRGSARSGCASPYAILRRPTGS